MGGMGGGTQAGIFPRGQFTIPLGRARFLLALGLIGDGSYFWKDTSALKICMSNLTAIGSRSSLFQS